MKKRKTYFRRLFDLPGYTLGKVMSVLPRALPLKLTISLKIFAWGGMIEARWDSVPLDSECYTLIRKIRNHVG
jgi:hypothetical protein